MKNVYICLLIFVHVVVTGCYRRVEIPKDELVNHANFSSPEGKQTFVVVKKDSKNSEEFSSFRVENRHLVGQLKNVKALEETSIPISNVQEVEKKEFSPGKTTIAVIGGVAGAFVLFLVSLAIIFVGSCDESCGPS